MMRTTVIAFLTGPFLISVTSGLVAEDKAEKDKKGARSVLDFKVKDIDGKEVNLDSFKGKTLILVNVASRCGLTEKQYEGLTKLHEKYKGKDFEILAFPANNFLKQEPGTDKEIKEFCSAKKVEFKLFSKISVKGDDIHPLYKFLTLKDSNPRYAGDIRWNFDKFLVSPKGEVVGRFEPKADPVGKEVTEAIEKSMKMKEKGAAR